MTAVFNDDIAANGMLYRLKAYYENSMYEEIRRQAEIDPHYDWGHGLNVLIVSDSALGRALGLFIYLSTKTGLNTVKLCMDLEDVKRYLDSGMIPNILIFVGLPKNFEIYQIIHMVSGQTMTVMFDFLDAIVELECRQYGIRYAFSSNRPIKDGTLYLREAFEDNKKYNQY